MRSIYNLVLRLAAICIFPILPFLLLNKKVRTGFRNRLGWLSKEKINKLKELSGPRIWFHAASVGELSVVAPIVRYMKGRNPRLGIIVTTMTVSGLNHVSNKVPEVDVCFLAPLDFPKAVKRIVQHIAPALLVIAETELWPNLILTAKESGSQLALVNGRLSKKNIGKYRVIGKLIRRVLEQFELLTIQSESDAARFVALGANPQRVKILNNVKSDDKFNAAKIDFRQALGIKPGQPVWVAGSTRPGEEPVIIEAFLRIKKAIPDALLILAPRHMSRLKEVEQLLIEKKQKFTYRTEHNNRLNNFSIILLDTIGELSGFYECGQVAFVGGSLMPFGGHNPFEPAIHGVPVIMGPHVDHFAQITEMLVKSRGALQVDNVEELTAIIIKLLSYPDEAKVMGERAKKAVANAQGSAEKTAEMLMKLMIIKQWASEVKTWRQESIRKNNYNRQKEDMLEDDWLLR